MHVRKRNQEDIQDTRIVLELKLTTVFDTIVSNPTDAKVMLMYTEHV